MREIVRHFFTNEKPVGAICHAAQVLIAAGVVRDRHVAAYEAMAPDIEVAGGYFEDSELVEDGNLVSSRVWPDIAAFSRGVIKMIEKEGIDVIPIKMRHSRMMGGGFHCVTTDIRRKGTLQRYFD